MEQLEKLKARYKSAKEEYAKHVASGIEDPMNSDYANMSNAYMELADEAMNHDGLNVKFASEMNAMKEAISENRSFQNYLEWSGPQGYDEGEARRVGIMYIEAQEALANALIA